MKLNIINILENNNFKKINKNFKENPLTNNFIMSNIIKNKLNTIIIKIKDCIYSQNILITAYGLTNEQSYVIRFYNLDIENLLKMNRKNQNGKIIKSNGSIKVGLCDDKSIYLKPNGFFSDNSRPNAINANNYDIEITDDNNNNLYARFFEQKYENNDNDNDVHFVGYSFIQLKPPSWYIPWYNIKQYTENRQVPLAWYFTYLLKHIDPIEYKRNFPFGL